MLDAAKLAEELRAEQENAQVINIIILLSIEINVIYEIIVQILEREKREQEARAKDLQVGE